MQRHLEEDPVPREVDGAAALEILARAPADQPVVVDFDETLLLRNSTSEYLRTVRPYLVGRLILLVLDLLRPWAWLPDRWFGPGSRDWFRVVAVTMLFPWTPLLWRRRAARLATGSANEDLVRALRDRTGSRVIVSSQGFRFVIRPLLERMGLGAVEFEACRFLAGFLDRRRGKLDRLVRLVGEDTVRRAVVITDSEDDRPLLDAAARPLLVRWPPPAASGAPPAYVPFLFMVRAKHGGWGHFRSMILGEDLVLLWLGLSLASPQPLLHACAMVFLLLSFWVIYEVGYMENDLVAERYERDPVLKPEFFAHREAISFREPWLWALLAALPGVWLLQVADRVEVPAWRAVTDGSLLRAVEGSWDPGALLRVMSWWVGLLAGLRLLYLVYNHADKMSRVWMYPLLQGMRSFGFAVLSPLSLPGAVAFLATVISRWMLYWVYRAARVEWPGTDVGQALRLALVAGLAGALLCHAGAREAMLSVQGGIILAWCAWRARLALVRILRDAHHVRGDSWKRPGR